MFDSTAYNLIAVVVIQHHIVCSLFYTHMQRGPIILEYSIGIVYNAYPQNILCLIFLPSNFEILLYIKPKKSQYFIMIEFCLPTEKFRPPSGHVYNDMQFSDPIFKDNILPTRSLCTRHSGVKPPIN